MDQHSKDQSPLPKAAPSANRRSIWSWLARSPWPLVDVLVLKTQSCPLCDEAWRQLQAKSRRLGLSLRKLDISDDRELLSLYGEEVPVVFIEGRKRFFGRVDSSLLKREVTAARERLP